MSVSEYTGTWHFNKILMDSMALEVEKCMYYKKCGNPTAEQ